MDIDVEAGEVIFQVRNRLQGTERLPARIVLDAATDCQRTIYRVFAGKGQWAVRDCNGNCCLDVSKVILFHLRLRIEDLAASGLTAIADLRLSEDRGAKHKGTRP